jgi:hypothetical protein
VVRSVCARGWTHQDLIFILDMTLQLCLMVSISTVGGGHYWETNPKRIAKRCVRLTD